MRRKRKQYFKEYYKANKYKKKKYMAAYLAKNRQERTEYLREYRKTREGKLAQAKADKKRNSSKIGRLKYRARKNARYALSIGKIKRCGCEICGRYAEMHHKDYSKPLEVTWLCDKHHSELHRRPK